MRRTFAARFVSVAALAALPSASATADDIQVRPEALPVALNRAEAGATAAKVDTTIEASAVEPIGDGRLALVAHDKTDELFVVEVATGKVVGPAVTTDAFPKSPFGCKWEGMTRDAEGNYYAVGSHSGKTAEERKAHAQMFRFRLKGTGAGDDPIAVDASTVVRWNVGGSLASVLARESSQAEKLKIEGLTVVPRPAANGAPARLELAVGLRAPTDLVRVFVTDITKTPEADAELSFDRLFAFDAGEREGVGRELTSLTYLPAWNGFFVVTATEDAANAFHGNALWFLPVDEVPRTGLARPQLVWEFEVAMKAEGIADLPDPGADPSSTARMVITYDNDAHNTHVPSRVQVVRLRRRSR